jgi:hypothetical protein
MANVPTRAINSRASFRRKLLSTGAVAIPPHPTSRPGGTNTNPSPWNAGSPRTQTSALGPVRCKSRASTPRFRSNAASPRTPDSTTGPGHQPGRENTHPSHWSEVLPTAQDSPTGPGSFSEGNKFPNIPLKRGFVQNQSFSNWALRTSVWSITGSASHSMARTVTGLSGASMGFLGNRAVGLGADIQQVIPAVVRAGGEIAHDGLRRFPVVVGLLVSPTFVHGHAGFPGAAAFGGAGFPAPAW